MTTSFSPGGKIECNDLYSSSILWEGQARKFIGPDGYVSRYEITLNQYHLQNYSFAKALSVGNHELGHALALILKTNRKKIISMPVR
jgi:hypothetical protein